MSLDWSVKKVKNWETVCMREDGTAREATKDLPWSLMLVGVPVITEKSAHTVFDRLEQYRIANGLGSDQGPSIELIRQHVGMSTNATRKTDREFDKQLDANRRDTCAGLAKQRDRERDALIDNVQGAKMEVTVKVTTETGLEQTFVAELMRGATLRTSRVAGMTTAGFAASPSSQFELRGRIKQMRLPQ